MDHCLILKLALFEDISENAIEHVLESLHAHVKHYKKGAYILHTGDLTFCMGIVLSGSVSVVQRDVWGNESIFHQVDEGEMFAETYAYLKHEPLMVDVVSTCDSKILFLDIHSLWNEEMNSTTALLTRNLTRLLAQKNLQLSRKIVHITPKTIRERLLSYLLDQSVKQGTTNLLIPFNRQQLSDYLCVDRSALSNEISKLQREGKMKVLKNEFYLVV